jgi:predicted nucleotidyltransferase
MLLESDKKIIQDKAAEYNVSQVLLFGSNLIENSETDDIDIAVTVVNSRRDNLSHFQLFSASFYSIYIVSYKRRSSDVLHLERIIKL